MSLESPPNSPTNKALLVIDYINEIVAPEGKLAAKGYAAFIKEHNTYSKLNKVIASFKDTGSPVIFIGVSFAIDYANQPKSSPLFGKAHDLGILAENTWSTQIYESIAYDKAGDTRLTKTRVSAFHNTELLTILRTNNITDVYLAGVATDLAVLSTALDAHDHDFTVFIVADACAAASNDDHNNALRTLKKVAGII
mgnify:CR=1 FL=1